MYPIIIFSPFYKKVFIDLQTLKWRIATRKTNKNYIYLTFYIVIFLLISFLSITKEKPTSPILFISIGLTLYHLLILQSIYILKKRHFSQINEIAEEFESKQMDCQYEFYENELKYWDKEKKFELSWSTFENYGIYQNFLILNHAKNISLIDSHIFDINKIPKNDFEQIEQLIKSKLPKINL